MTWQSHHCCARELFCFISWAVRVTWLQLLDLELRHTSLLSKTRNESEVIDPFLFLGTLAHDLITRGGNDRVVNLEVKKRVKLTGTELEDYKRKRTLVSFDLSVESIPCIEFINCLYLIN